MPILHLLILSATSALIAFAVHSLSRSRGWTTGRRLGRSKPIPPPTSEGGLIFLLGFLVCLAYSSRFIGEDILLSAGEMKQAHIGLALALVWIWTVGRWGDSKGLPHLFTTAAVAVGGGIAYAFGFEAQTVRLGESVHDLGVWSAPFTILWLVVVSEFFRLLDGLDGMLLLAVGAAVASQFWILEPEEGYALLLCGALAPVLLGMLPWRIYPARVELRGIGAHLPGFIFGAVTLVGRQKAFTTKAVLIPSIILIAVLSLFALWVLEQRLFLPKGEKKRTPA